MSTERLINRAYSSLVAGMPEEELVSRIVATEEVSTSDAYLAVIAGKILARDASASEESNQDDTL